MGPGGAEGRAVRGDGTGHDELLPRRVQGRISDDHKQERDPEVGIMTKQQIELPLQFVVEERLYGYEGRRFVAYWWFVGWWALSFGAHVSLRDPNIEIHLPFGFLRIGWLRP
jgi:hypothetical protein